MVVDEQGDTERFLADLTGFLNELAPASELQPAGVAPEAPDLLVDSDQLLAETEALLSTCAPALAAESSVPARPADSDNTKALDERRREIKNAQAAKRRLKYRNKLKNERQTLLEQEKTLSEDLASLQHARKKVKSLQEKSVTVPLWKGIATRQMEGRLVAEEQQRRLKSAVASRAKAIAEVKEAMRQELCGASCLNICADAGVVTKQEILQLDADDVALFEDYLQDMDIVYAQTNQAFRDSGVEECPPTSYRVEPGRKWEGDTEYFESLDVLLIPFSYHQASSAMWQAMLRVHQQNDRQHYRGVADPDNTIAVKLPISCSREAGGSVNLLVHLVTRRYVEADRMVIVWRAMTEGEDEFSGMHSDETGWCVVRPNQAESAGYEKMQTIMQTFSRFVPVTVAARRADKAQADQFAKLVVTSGEEDGLEISRMMESLLLNDDAHTGTTVLQSTGTHVSGGR
ncbi:unnamed protein product [Phytophthora lilii]|uniref:Unnamed protein product n=1 Tax=Phytophthora lilii TaxID=2077276 RepID=A0A9W6WRN3_9STRA|nr:unnamed protein product [Phytophthora lilii]